LFKIFSSVFESSEEVLSSCGIQTDDEGNLLPDEKPKRKSGKKKKVEPVISLEDLRHMMEEAITNEEYELAAQYRDKIAELEKK
jgi:protein-arginine kinase activator protein McsA